MQSETIVVSIFRQDIEYCDIQNRITIYYAQYSRNILPNIIDNLKPNMQI